MASFECEPVFIDCDAAVVEMDSGSLRGKEEIATARKRISFACLCMLLRAFAAWKGDGHGGSAEGALSFRPGAS